MNTSDYSGDRGRAYFEQRAHNRSEETQRRRATFFRGLGGPGLTILDFGCGTGGVLASLTARQRLGVEVSPYAAAAARTVLDAVFEDMSEISSGSVDVVISFHALEHVPDPFRVLKDVRRVLIPGGRFRLFVPHAADLWGGLRERWEPNDPDMHLFSWTPMTFGNLCNRAGLSVTDCSVLPTSVTERFGGNIGRSVAWMKSAARGRFQVCANGFVPE